jgi:hypothetical protein
MIQVVLVVNLHKTIIDINSLLNVIGIREKVLEAMLEILVGNRMQALATRKKTL